MSLSLSTNLLSAPTDREGMLKEIDSLPPGASVDDIFFYNSPNSGKFLRRVMNSCIRMSNIGAYGTGSDFTTKLANACAHPDIQTILFDYSKATTVTINGSVAGAGKRIIFSKGNMFNGTGTIDNIEYDAGDFDQCFSTTLTVTNVKPTRGYISARVFGALANGSDDTVKLQKSIDLAVYSGHNWFLPKGVYTTTKGLLFLRDSNADGQPDFLSIKIYGVKKAYSNALSNGPESVISCNHNDNFGIGIQRFKGCIVDSIGVLGRNTNLYTVAQVVDPSSTFVVNGCRTNAQSPYAGIALDPIGKNTVSAGNRYPGFESNYDNLVGNGGGSDILIENCTVRYFVVNYVDNPHGTTQNSDLIKIRNCWGDYCVSAIGIGESQSRSFKLDNFYCWGSTKYVINCRDYGASTAPTPEVNGINIAGGVKYLFKGTGFLPHGGFRNVYAESLFAIGGDLSSANGAYQGVYSFKDCYFNFLSGGGEAQGITPMLMKCDVVSFDSCQLFYYAGSLTAGINIAARYVQANNCMLYGPVWITKTLFAGGTHAEENVQYKGCSFGGGIITTRDDFYQNVDQLGSSSVFYYGPGVRQVIDARNRHERVRTFKGRMFGYSFSTGYNVTSEIVSINVLDDRDWTFTTSNPTKITVGDLIMINNSSGAAFTAHDTLETVTPIVGSVITVVGSLVTVRGKLNEMTNGSTWQVNTTYLKKIFKTHIGDITSGSATISNVASESSVTAVGFANGTRLDHPSFPLGAYIVSTTSNSITMSANATASETGAALYTVDYVETSKGNRASMTPPEREFFKAGDIMYNDLLVGTDNEIFAWITTKHGITTTGPAPIWKPVWFNKNTTTTLASVDGSVAIAAGDLVKTVVVTPASPLTAFSIGTTNGGGEILPAQPLASGANVIVINWYYPTSGSIWFNGITSSTAIKLYID